MLNTNEEPYYSTPPNASHILAALVDGPITTNYLVVRSSSVSPMPTNSQLDAAYLEMQRVLVQIAHGTIVDAMAALTRAYAAIGATNPIDDLLALRSGYHPVFLARALGL